MTDLADDIARIAALRGRHVANYEQIERDRRKVSHAEIVGLFRVPDAMYDEMREFDRLPATSRQALSNLPLNASAIRYKALLNRARDERGLIRVIAMVLPEVVHGWVKRHYGTDHPTTRKET